jgi:hypothetical protein
MTAARITCRKVNPKLDHRIAFAFSFGSRSTMTIPMMGRNVIQLRMPIPRNDKVMKIPSSSVLEKPSKPGFLPSRTALGSRKPSRNYYIKRNKK